MIDDIFGPFFLERASEKAYWGRIENETNRDEPNAGKQKDADRDPYLSCVRMGGTHPITALLRTDWNDEAHGAPRPYCTTCFKCLIVFPFFVPLRLAPIRHHVRILTLVIATLSIRI